MSNTEFGRHKRDGTPVVRIDHDDEAFTIYADGNDNAYLSPEIEPVRVAGDDEVVVKRDVLDAYLGLTSKAGGVFSVNVRKELRAVLDEAYASDAEPTPKPSAYGLGSWEATKKAHERGEELPLPNVADRAAKRGRDEALDVVVGALRKVGGTRNHYLANQINRETNR